MDSILGGAIMIKEIIKIIISGIVVYPIGLLLFRLDRPNSDINWFVLLIIDIVVAICLIVSTILKYKKKKEVMFTFNI